MKVWGGSDRGGEDDREDEVLRDRSARRREPSPGPEQDCGYQEQPQQDRDQLGQVVEEQGGEPGQPTLGKGRSGTTAEARGVATQAADPIRGRFWSRHRQL